MGTWKKNERALPPEELSEREKSQQIKTLFERSQGFLERGQFDGALTAVEEVFVLDPENREASRRVDEIKEKARRQGAEESTFLKGLYQVEIESRIHRYVREAETHLGRGRREAARVAIEKIFLLDSENQRAQELEALLDVEDETGKTL